MEIRGRSEPAERVTHVSTQMFLDPIGHLDAVKVEAVDSIARDTDLRIVIAVLSHARDAGRYVFAESMLIGLRDLRRIHGVRIVWSHQGTLPGDTRSRISELDVDVVEHLACDFVDGSGEEYHCAVGKTEHVVLLLDALRGTTDVPERTFVVTLDDDYVVFDIENVFAMFAPWVLGCGGVEGYENIAFTKGGGSRLVVPRQFADDVATGVRPVLTFRDLCEGVLALAGWPDPTIGTRGMALGPETIADGCDSAKLAALRGALELYTRSGARVSRGLSTYLVARGGAFGRALSRFSFLLHGDQGATLDHWSRMELARGYDLELWFLAFALFNPLTSSTRIANVVTIPHAHVPKSEAANFEMGVGLFSTLLLLEAKFGLPVNPPADPAVFGDPAIRYFSVADFYRVYEATVTLSPSAKPFPPLDALRRVNRD